MIARRACVLLVLFLLVWAPTWLLFRGHVLTRRRLCAKYRWRWFGGWMRRDKPSTYSQGPALLGNRMRLNKSKRSETAVRADMGCAIPCGPRQGQLSGAPRPLPQQRSGRRDKPSGAAIGNYACNTDPMSAASAAAAPTLSTTLVSKLPQAA